MNIDPTQNPGRINNTEVRDVNRTTGAQAPKQTDAPRESARYQASMASDTSQDIDAARVAEIRQAISDGKLEINADRIADGIIASARSLLEE